MMMNGIYNGMNAQELANRLIEAEEAYLKTEVESLSFEEKCRLLMENTSTYHPLYRQMDLSALAVSISPELLQRAEDFDPDALYCLAATFGVELPRKESRLEYLERAVHAGSAEARVQYASRFFPSDKPAVQRMLSETLARYDLTELNEETLYRCYDLLSDCAATPEECAVYARLADELALKFLLEGKFRALAHLCVKKCDAEEKVFWKTVAYLARSYFYEKGATQFESLLRDPQTDLNEGEGV